MKKLSFILLLMVVCGLSAFGQNSGKSSQGMRSADPNVFEVSEYNETLYDCYGNPIELSGTIMVIIHRSPAGNNLTMKGMAHFLGVVGINQVTGEKYHLIGQEFIMIRTFAFGQSYVISAQEKMHLVGQQSGSALHVRRLRHITVHRDQTWDMVIDQLAIKCEGEPAFHIKF